MDTLKKTMSDTVRWTFIAIQRELERDFPIGIVEDDAIL